MDFKNIPSDYREYTRSEIAKQNNLNKQRSKNHELTVAKFMGGTRVPMSGGGSIKGDGICNTPFGAAIIECKYTSIIAKIHGPQLRMRYEWIPKLESDVRAMRGLGVKFGFFDFHFHMQTGGYRNDISIIPEKWATEFINPELYEQGFVFNRPGITFPVRRYEIDRCYQLNPVFPACRLLTNYGNCVILPLAELKELLTKTME